MSRSRRLWWAWSLGLVLIATGSPARADLTWNVSLDTSALAADPASGPYALDFVLIGSDGNRVTLSNFAFGGGSSGPGGPIATSGASGSLTGTVVLDDTSDFFVEFSQQFTPGGSLSFTVDSTAIPPSGNTPIPDNFSMFLLSGYDPSTGAGTPIVTSDQVNNTFLSIDINGPGATTPVSSAGGANGDIPITVAPTGVVPELSSGAMMLFGLLSLAGVLAWRRGGDRRPP